MITVLVFGDIFGKPGRKAVQAALPDLQATYQPDFIIGNAENLAGGRGVNRKVYNEMRGMGFHALTTGNHVWDNKDILNFIDQEERLLRPANLPSPPDMKCPGRGFSMIHNGGKSLMLINLMGRVFMDDTDCPFAKADEILKDAPKHTPILVDMHADATSEKYAMGWHLNGRVSAVWGTHSHVQTADERILPGGTAYISDVGMSGAFDSVIGLEPEPVIKKFLTRRSHGYHIAKGNPGVGCIIIKIEHNGKASSIERLRFSVNTEHLNDGDLE